MLETGMSVQARATSFKADVIEQRVIDEFMTSIGCTFDEDKQVFVGDGVGPLTYEQAFHFREGAEYARRTHKKSVQEAVAKNDADWRSRFDKFHGVEVDGEFKTMAEIKKAFVALKKQADDRDEYREVRRKRHSFADLIIPPIDRLAAFDLGESQVMFHRFQGKPVAMIDGETIPFEKAVAVLLKHFAETVQTRQDAPPFKAEDYGI